MANEPISDVPTVENAQLPGPQKPRGRVLLRFLAISGFVGCAFSAVLLYQGNEREAALRFELLACDEELHREYAARRQAEAGRDKFQSEVAKTRSALQEATAGLAQVRSGLQQSESERNALQRDLENARGDLQAVIARREELQSMLREAEFEREEAKRLLVSARTELSECNGSLAIAVDAARAHRDKLEDISSAIRIGMIGVSDIPMKRTSIRLGFDAESEYRQLVDEYNDLVRRFNAAVERSNDLGGILNDVIDVLRR